MQNVFFRADEHSDEDISTSDDGYEYDVGDFQDQSVLAGNAPESQSLVDKNLKKSNTLK